MTRLLMFLATALLLAMPAARADDSYTEKDAELAQGCMDDAAQTLQDGDPDNDTSLTDCIGVASNACQEEPGGSSTQGIAQCNERERAWWDEQLNQNYQATKDTVTPEAFALLQKAQRAWMAFRDADCDYTYEVWKDGTIRTVFYTSCLLDKTARRAIELIPEPFD